MMFKCSICALLVIPILFVNSEDPNNISTTLRITKSNKTYPCQHEGDLEMEDGDELLVEVTHIKYIDFVLLTNPTEKRVKVPKGGAGNNKKVVAKYNVSGKQTGKWIFETLTAANATQVISDQYTEYENTRYHVEQCVFNITVNGRDGSWVDNWVYWAIIGFSFLTLIIVIQTFVICRTLKKKKVRRIEQLALSNSARSGCDTARYSTTPGKKPTKPQADGDCESIYECLDKIQSANDAPPPPPLETLPRPRKNDKVPLIPGDSSQHSTLSRNPITEEDRVKTRPQLPLPFEVNGASPPFQPGHSETPTRTPPKPESNVTNSMRGPNKVKLPPFCSPSKIPPSPGRPAPKMIKKLTVNQDPLANELNNILKRRQTGAGGVAPTLVKPEKVEAIPETKPKLAPEQGFKPPTFAKPTTPMTPTKQLPKPMGPTTVGTLPKNTPTQQPLIPTPAPKPAVARKWPAVNTQGTQSQASPSHAPPQPMHTSHPPQPQPHPGLGRGHPMHRPAHPMPHPVHPTQQHQRKLPPLPVQPMDGPEEEAEYNLYEKYEEQEVYEEFQEFEEDDEEWTYEALPQYNIYANAEELARVSSP